MRLDVNGRGYTVPPVPVVAVTVDGGDPRYFDDALERGLTPRLAELLGGGGAYVVGRSEMPSLTNPNNLSIVTGCAPSGHGVPGNHCRVESGEMLALDRPEVVRAPSIHSVFEAHGVRTLCITVKDKLRRLLSRGGVPTVSVERPTASRYRGWNDLTTVVKGPPPDVYAPEASGWALRLAAAAVRRDRELRLVYVSLTDRVQHAAAPGTPLADAFMRSLDAGLGALLDAGCTVGLTADHGMNDKHDAAGRPRVQYLASALERAGVRSASVILPITDPYVRHHGGLGSFAWVYVEPDEQQTAADVLRSIDGVESVLDRRSAVAHYEHPADRIGDLSVSADARTVLGTRVENHDLDGLHGPLRSHGGVHEQAVPLILSSPPDGGLPDRPRSRDLHHLLLNPS